MSGFISDICSCLGCVNATALLAKALLPQACKLDIQEAWKSRSQKQGQLFKYDFVQEKRWKRNGELLKIQILQINQPTVGTHMCI